MAHNWDDRTIEDLGWIYRWTNARPNHKKLNNYNYQNENYENDIDDPYKHMSIWKPEPAFGYKKKILNKYYNGSKNSKSKNKTRKLTFYSKIFVNFLKQVVVLCG